MKKRFCSRPYRFLHFDPDGSVRLCAWMDISIGNIFSEDIKTIYHGEKAKELRSSFDDGSFRFCRATSCPYLENDSLEYVDEKAYERMAVVEELPKAFNIANDFVCNHNCPSCREHIYKPDAKYLKKFEEASKIIIPLLNQAELFSACGNGDLFSSPHMLKMLSEVHPTDKNCRVGLETNGALFDKVHWAKISHFGGYRLSVTVTPNSFVETTYRYLNGGHNDYRQLMKNLVFIRQLREKEIVNHYEISIVVQERNFLELPSFVKRCLEEFHVDSIIVKPLYKWFFMSDDDYWFKDVANPLHPYHSEWQEVMRNPILDDPHVFLWGARNEHEAARHPAYWQEKMAKCLAKLVMMDDCAESIKQWMEKNNAARLILYGENVLTAPIVKLLKDTIPCVRVMAKYPVCDEIEGVPVVAFAKDNFIGGDAVLVLNFDKMEYIQRDFSFVGINVAVCSIETLLFM